MLSVLRWFGILACCLLCGGCWPSAQAPLDEQKESNFLTGKARTQDRDYDGAIEAFEKALEANPHSASAYFELAVIYDQHKNDYAAALYHYEKARRLRPNAYPADIAKDRLEVCKRELAKTVMVNLDGRLAMAVVPASRKVVLELLARGAGARSAELAQEREFEGRFPG